MQTSCTTKNKPKPSSFNAIGPFVESFEHSRSQQESDSSYEYETTDQQERCALSKSAWLKISFAFSIAAMGVILLLALTLCQTTNDRFATAMRFEGPYNDVVQDKSTFLEDCNSALEELKCTSVESEGENGILVHFEGKRSAASNLKAQHSNAHVSNAMRSFLQILEDGLKLSNGTTLYPKHVQENVGLKADLDKAKAELEEKQNFLETEITRKQTEIDESNEKNARLEEQQRTEINEKDKKVDELETQNAELRQLNEGLSQQVITLKCRISPACNKGKPRTNSMNSDDVPTAAPSDDNNSSSVASDCDVSAFVAEVVQPPVDPFQQLSEENTKLKEDNNSLKLAVTQKKTKDKTLRWSRKTIKRMQATKKRDETQKQELRKQRVHAQLYGGQAPRGRSRSFDSSRSSDSNVSRGTSVGSSVSTADTERSDISQINTLIRIKEKVDKDNALLRRSNRVLANEMIKLRHYENVMPTPSQPFEEPVFYNPSECSTPLPSKCPSEADSTDYQHPVTQPRFDLNWIPSGLLEPIPRKPQDKLREPDSYSDISTDEPSVSRTPSLSSSTNSSPELKPSTAHLEPVPMALPILEPVPEGSREGSRASTPALSPPPPATDPTLPMWDTFKRQNTI